MESVANYYVSVIQENRSLLVQDLLSDVVDDLRQSNVINDEEYSQIMGKEYVPAKNFHVVAERLLDLLMDKPHGNVIKFVKLLKNNYQWLYQLFDDDQTKECLLLGGVPALPKILAKREELLSRVRESLFKLKRGHFVVLLGMPGCGKTTLAAHCLHDATLLQNFNNTLLWVSTNFDDISSIQTNINILLKDKSVQLLGDTKNDRLLLMNALSGSECLMILDDVQTPSLVEALNIGCKILITARDKTVMKNFEAVTEFIEVDSSFTLEETLNVFTQAIGLNEDISKLPFDATSIHTLARGFPLTVSLLVGILEDNKESASQNNSLIWKNLKNLLEKKQYGALKRSSIGNEVTGKCQLNHVISRAVENLREPFKEFFKYFALFVEDINIKQEVFCTLWKVKEIDVQEILLYFVKKSLIVRKWVEKNYVYGVHDIILSYLKEDLSSANLVKLHKKLIERYTEKCPGNDLSKLPRNDNYIFYYIGYHLKAAKEINKLIDLYTNLEFIEAKLKITGPADLLTDYNKYLHDIENQVDLNKVREINKFIEKCGREINTLAKQGNESVDIVQFIFQETHTSSYLYKAAQQLAAKRKASYINFPIGPFSKGNEPSEILHQTACVTSMRPTVFNDLIVVGYENGSIVLYNTKIKGAVNRYVGHEGGPIRGLALNKDNSYFLSYSLDKRISIWRLDAHCTDLFSFEGGCQEPRTPSPVTIQENHSPLWQSKAIMSFTHLPHQGVLLCAVYGQHHPSLIASSTAHSLMVWVDNEIGWYKSIENVHSCLFCKNDTLVLAGASKIIGFSTDKGIIMFETSLPINLSIQSSVISLLMNPENPEDVLVTTQDVISLWSFACTEKQCRVFHPVNQYRFYQLADIGKYIAVAYADSEIEIFEKDSAASLGLFHNQKGEVKCISLTYDKLYAAYSDKTICVWPLSEISSAIDSLPLNPVSIVWFDGSPHIASFSKNNSILVKKERKLIVEISDVHDVHMVKLSDDCKLVTYCHEKENYLSRSFIEHPHPSTNKFNSRPSALSVYKHQDRSMVLAVVEEGQLLVWCENKMTFRGQSNTRVHNAYYLLGSIICVLSNGSLEEYKVDDPSYYRCIHQEDIKTSAYLADTSSKNHIAIAYETGAGAHMLTVYNPFEVVFREVLPSKCMSMAFSPNGTYLALCFPEKQFIWVWKDLKGKSKGEIKCPPVNGMMAISNDGSVCIRTEQSILLLASAYDHPNGAWSKSFMSTHKPLVTASPSHSCLFATVDSCLTLHTFSPFEHNRVEAHLFIV